MDTGQRRCNSFWRQGSRRIHRIGASNKWKGQFVEAEFMTMQHDFKLRPDYIRPLQQFFIAEAARIDAA
ncbi:hypothetical protein A9K76_00980 [Stenotrophomonas maltophilia]|nr:hypothetical protein A9K76_00980 [Stenotrophomonas maltophilia]